VRLYRVISPSGARGRLEGAAAIRGLTPFVGREEELHVLINRWERVLGGHGEVVLIVGEPGIGKSRLMRRFHEQITDGPYNWIQAAAGSFFQNTPFYPVAKILRQLPAYDNEPSQSEEPYSKLALSRGFAPAPVNSRRNWPGFRSVGVLDLLRPAEQQLSPHQRRRLLSKVVEWVLGAAQGVYAPD
jgi:predicted ATPase